MSNNAFNPNEYCRQLIIKTALDGAISFASKDPNTSNIVNYTSNTLILGNKGDKNITCVFFDFSELINSTTSPVVLDDYAINILFTYIDDNNAKQLKIFGVEYDNTNECWYWIVPDELYEEVKNYQTIITITERNGTHTYASDTEVWVSHEFECSINDTLWHILNITILPTTYDFNDAYNFLMKPAITLNTPINYYNINTSSQDLGTKRDAYMKRLELQESFLNNTLDICYGIFIPNKSYLLQYKVYFEYFPNLHMYGCLVPKEITFRSGDIECFIIATNAAHTKRWVSNTLNFTVTDNFLDLTDNMDSRLDWSQLDDLILV